MTVLKKVENIIIKLIIIQFVCLLFAQGMTLYTNAAPYMSKVVHYEGVNGQTIQQYIETFDQQK
ncbi:MULTISPECIES: DUF5359 family protein [Bacillus]|uniref:DUF5359 family protein n=1 Tax=Bacillus TaxID=1386 RepID=UPI0029DE8792|nr:DUF5359 family protein [Bacillus alkalisoli]